MKGVSVLLCPTSQQTEGDEVWVPITDLTAKQAVAPVVVWSRRSNLNRCPADYEFWKASRFSSTSSVFNHAIASTTHPNPPVCVPGQQRDSHPALCRHSLLRDPKFIRCFCLVLDQVTPAFEPSGRSPHLRSPNSDSYESGIRSNFRHFLSSRWEATAPIKKNETSAPTSNSKGIFGGIDGCR